MSDVPKNNPYRDPVYSSYQHKRYNREDWLLRLALIKESVAYRKFWTENAEKCLNALIKLDEFYDTLPEELIDSKEESERFVRDYKWTEDTIFEFDRQLFKFDLGAFIHGFSEFAPEWDKLEPVWMALDPANEEIPEKMPFPLYSDIDPPIIQVEIPQKNGKWPSIHPGEGPGHMPIW